MHILRKKKGRKRLNYRTHRLGGICAGLVISSAVDPTFTPVTVATITVSSFIGSLVPDIDEPTSFIGRKVPLLSKPLKFLFKHRGIVHTPIFCVLISILIYLGLRNFLDINIIKNILIGFITGYASHLILDTFTPKGIMWLSPFSRRYFSTQSEWFIGLMLISAVTAFFVIKYDAINLVLNALK